ncbi:hypothetical protein GCM10009784_28740 [Arthrobacter parietis]|uniref:NlpC/P60 domain-containing protein n=1 Tax=Arthrobacter parietis TaxID=271434 RepID=A0ABN3B194_9MICC
MSNSSALGRHRAVPAHTNSLAAISRAVSSNAGSVGRQAAVIVAASGLVLTAGLPAHGASDAQRSAQAVKTLSAVAAQPVSVSAAADATVTFERAAVEAVAAPVVEAVEPAPAVTVQAEAVVQNEAAVAAPAPVVEPAVEVAAAPQAEVEVKAPAAEAPAPVEAPTSSGIGAALVGSAYSQIGVAQDCTAMVEKALRSIGKSVGDIAPSDFFAFGSVVSTPAPGDLVVSAGHVAIYVGNGQVISGGLNGMNTGLHSLSDLAGSSFVRVS